MSVISNHDISTGCLPPAGVTGETLASTIKKTAQYLLSIQYPGGYWMGELTADSSVTAGYMPLMFFMTGQVNRERQNKAVDFIIQKQREDGSWVENAYTGTGFPRAFYLKYDLYRIYFPLMASSLYHRRSIELGRS